MVDISRSVLFKFMLRGLIMETHKIEICETLCRVVEVEAKNVDDAIDIVRGRYQKSEIVLDSDDYQDFDIKVL